MLLYNLNNIMFRKRIYLSYLTALIAWRRGDVRGPFCRSLYKCHSNNGERGPQSVPVGCVSESLSLQKPRDCGPSVAPRDAQQGSARLPYQPRSVPYHSAGGTGV